ncbi:unnamed protein product, partial [Amoebophrya sp. A120]
AATTSTTRITPTVRPCIRVLFDTGEVEELEAIDLLQTVSFEVLTPKKRFLLSDNPDAQRFFSEEAARSAWCFKSSFAGTAVHQGKLCLVRVEPQLFLNKLDRLFLQHDTALEPLLG